MLVARRTLRRHLLRALRHGALQRIVRAVLGAGECDAVPRAGLHIANQTLETPTEYLRAFFWWARASRNDANVRLVA